MYININILVLTIDIIEINSPIVLLSEFFAIIQEVYTYSITNYDP